MEPVQLILGTMTIGEQVFGPQVREMIDTYLHAGGRELDTAYVYNDGNCEKLLGEALVDIDRSSYRLATKANPRITGHLNRVDVLTQANESLQRLGINALDTLYLHFPNQNTDLESMLSGCAQLHEEGKIRELGVSNFPAWLVAECCAICDRHGWIRPTVYQGLYNALSRHAERELFTALRYYGMRFYAYNPLAGGMLTNKYSAADRTLKEGRFTNRPGYQKRYWKDSYFEAADAIKTVAGNCGIGIVEAAYRWLAYHSAMDAACGDGIIIGASRVQQLTENLSALNNGPLPEVLVQTIEEAWEICRIDAPEYFRYL